jgi:hypothetical protein
MFRSAIRTRTARVALVAGTLLALTTGGAYATGVLGSPVGADGVIHGCYQKFNGTLRLVAADNPACRSSEQQIAWSETGPKGEKGDQGVQGVPGERGATGLRGQAGVSGYQIVDLDFTADEGTLTTVTVTCPTGKVVIGGGAWLFTNPRTLADVVPRLLQSAPIDSSTWEIKLDNNGSPFTWDYRGRAICINAS